MPLDKYANLAAIQVTESVADTLTFQELRTGMGIEPNRKSARAMVIDEIDFFPGQSTLGALGAAGDGIEMALAVSNVPTAINDVTDRRILASANLYRIDSAAAATNFHVIKTPIPAQFFPPLITAERSIYLGVRGINTAIANVLRCRIYYRVVTISEGEFIELVEAFTLVG